jgi:hypothetical protein
MRLYKNGDWKQKKIFGNYIGFVSTKLKVLTHWKLGLISLYKNAIKQPLNLTCLLCQNKFANKGVFKVGLKIICGYKLSLEKKQYEKLCLLKSHCLAIRVQKTTHIQLLCNHPLWGITIIMQLSPWKYGELINKFPSKKIS